MNVCNMCGSTNDVDVNVCRDCKDKVLERGKYDPRKRKYYIGAPEKCDICEKPFKKMMYDGATRGGPWANMCEPCFTVHGRGLGLGVGQRYTKQHDGKWLKTGG